jgi:hypothetical protein
MEQQTYLLLKSSKEPEIVIRALFLACKCEVIYHEISGDVDPFLKYILTVSMSASS